MRMALAAVLLALVASAGRAEEGAAPPPPAGKIEVPEPTFDAGKVARGTTVRHAFLVKNVGTAELSIDAKPG